MDRFMKTGFILHTNLGHNLGLLQEGTVQLGGFGGVLNGQANEIWIHFGYADEFLAQFWQSNSQGTQSTLRQ